MDDVNRAAVAKLIQSAAAAFSLDLEDASLLRQGRATVVRAQNMRGPAIGNVIIKQFMPFDRQRFLRERTGLMLLSSLPELDGFVPRLLGDDDVLLALLIENVPERDSYANLIFSSDVDMATPLLADTARRLGVLHGYARSLVPEFSSMVSQPLIPGLHLSDSLGGTLAFLRRALSDGVSHTKIDEFAVGSTVHSQLLKVAEGVDVTNPLWTITVGDMAPSNIILGPQGPVFIDLEYCAVRHAFYDAMFWHCICSLSGDIADRLDGTYQEGLQSAGVQIDEEHFLRMMFLFMTHRLFWTLSWNMEALFEQDREIVPGVSTRTILRQYLREYSRFAAKLPGLEQASLPGVARRLEDELSQLWPEADPLH